MSIRQQIRSRLRRTDGYNCGFCSLRFDAQRENCPACGGIVTKRR